VFRALSRSLVHYRRMHLAVGLGVAVATAVLSGALLVGVSVRASLRAMTLERLGGIEAALVAPRLLDATLTDRLDSSLAGQGHAVGALLLEGTALGAKSRRRATSIQIQGIDDAFVRLFSADRSGVGQSGIGPSGDSDIAALLRRPSGQPFASVVINRALQQELGVELGQDLLLNFERPSDVHREALFGERRAEEVVQTVRLRLAGVLDEGPWARFSLRPHQNLPLNAYIWLPELQKALDAPERINAILTSSGKAQEAMAQVWRLADAGLGLERREDFFSIESPGYLLGTAAAAAAKGAAAALGLVHRPVFTYLATALRVGSREVAYSLVCGLDTAVEGLGSLVWESGRPGSLEADEIVLNAWAARRLGAVVGDEVVLEYFEVGPRDELVSRQLGLRLRGVVGMEGLGADPSLTPDFPGLHQADDMAAWDAPFPVDLDRILPDDEDYWDQYAAAPKAFISLATAQRLWHSRFGSLSAVRLGAAGGGIQPEDEALATQVLGRLDPSQTGLFFKPVRQEGLEAAAGATDFSGLFIGFSFFLIAAAVLLVGLLFRLGVEGRAAELGLLLALGYPVWAVRRRLLAEGALVAVLGGLVGTVGALLYAELMLQGLRTWWSGAVGGVVLRLYPDVASLVLGLALSLAAVLAAVWIAVRQLSRVAPPALLRGTVSANDGPAAAELKAGRGFWIGGGGALLGTGLLVVAWFSPATTAAGLFFGAGAVWLVAGIGFLHGGLQRMAAIKPGGRRFGMGGLWGLGIRNSARHPGRSLLCAGLVACAAFVVVAVGANRRPPLDPEEIQQRDSGSGGFGLVGRTAISLHGDLDTPTGREKLGLDQEAEALLGQTRIFPLRLLPGEDASCLNLYLPQKPTILGVPPALRQRGGFAFQESLPVPQGADPWSLLAADLGPGVIPAVADFNSAQWILHTGLGEELTLNDGEGRPVRLRLVGLLRDSIFQGELLVASENFERLFPRQSGHSFFLVEAPVQTLDAVAAALEEGLEAFGFDATTSAARLTAYHAVENTYLATFQTLGGLGLLLGTVGLGVVLLRNALERRRELATLRAFGFRSRLLTRLLLAENGFLLLAGLGIGCGAALAAVMPRLLDPASVTDWGGLAATVGAVALVGLLASRVAASIASRAALVAALKGD
jgi:putative ABC transport system permease protein